MIEAAIELSFVQLANGLTDVVVTESGIVGVRRRIEIDELLANRVDHTGRDFVATGTSGLDASGGSGERIAASIALEGRKAAVGV